MFTLFMNEVSYKLTFQHVTGGSFKVILREKDITLTLVTLLP